MGQPGAKKLDQIVSVTPGDVHMIQPPGPSPPVPVPHPVPNSLIKDEVAEKVKVMGFPGAVKGSISQHTPPHIPIGGTFVNPPKNKGKITTGSANVFYEDKAAAMMGDTAEMCMDPSDAPVGKVIGKAAMVLVGGGGSGGDGDGSGDGDGKKAGGAGKAGLAQVTATGHPVDVATGNLIITCDDLTLDGPLPIQFVRTYVSASASVKGPMGYGWVHNLQEGMEIVAEGHPEWSRIHNELTEAGNPSPEKLYLIYRDPNGLPTNYRFPRSGEELKDEPTHRRIRRDGGTCTLIDRFGIASRFTHVAGPQHVLHLTEIEDRNGNRNRYRYNENGLLSEVRDCYKRTLLLVYEGQRLIEIRLRVSAEQPAQRWFSYKQNEAGDLIEVTDRAGFSDCFAYADHLMVQDRNRDGYSFYFQYDDKRRCIRTWGEDGYLTRYLEFDAERRRTRVTNGEGEVTVYSWLPSGVVRQTESAEGMVQESVFDDLERPVVSRSGNRPLVTSAYDDAGRIASMADSEQNEVAFAYNPAGQIKLKTNPDGSSEEFKYDSKGNMTSRGVPGGASVEFERDERGRVVKEYHPDGRVIRIEYDSFGHALSIGDGRRAVHTEYDPLGNLLRMARTWATPFTYEWNVQGYVSRVKEGERVTAEFEYNKSGDVTSALDDHGYLHRFVVKRPGLVSEYSRFAPAPPGSQSPGPLVYQVKFQQDTEGRRLAAIDHLGRATRTTFDRDGRIVRLQQPDGTAVELQYGPDSIVRRAASVSGGTQFYHFDGRGLPTEVEYHDGTRETFEYDELGRLTAAANKSAELAFAYDKAGRQIARKQGDYSFEATVEPKKGRVTWNWPEGLTLEYEEGEMGLTSSMEFAGRKIDLVRDVHGELTGLRYPNGLMQEIERDWLGRVTGLRLEADSADHRQARRKLFQQKFNYREQGGQLASVEDDRWGDRRFSYDFRERLIRVERRPDWDQGETESRRNEFYTYDDRDNLVASHRFTQAGYSADQAMKVGDREYHYDRQGRVSAVLCPDGQNLRLEYDAKGQISRVRLPDGGTVEYKYDPLGRRVEKVFKGGRRDGRIVRFYWDVDTPIKEEEWAGEELTKERFYAFTGFTLLARLDRNGEGDQGQAYFYHNDVSGRPQLCTDEQGNVVWESSLDSYGAGGGQGTLEQNFRLPGQYFDEETGLCYNRHRYYDPHSARFLQPDPIARLMDVNRYSYPTDPLTKIDPSGLETRILSGDTRDPVVGGGILKDGTFFEGSEVRLQRAYSGAKISDMFDSSKPNLAGVDHVVVVAHGSPDKMWVRDLVTGKETTMTGKELGKYLKDQGFKGKQVTIMSCNTGNSSGTFAQDVANELGPGVNVTAPTNKVAIDGSGQPVVREGGHMKDFQAETVRATPSAKADETTKKDFSKATTKRERRTPSGDTTKKDASHATTKREKRSPADETTKKAKRPEDETTKRSPRPTAGDTTKVSSPPPPPKSPSGGGG